MDKLKWGNFKYFINRLCTMLDCYLILSDMYIHWWVHVCIVLTLFMLF